MTDEQIIKALEHNASKCKFYEDGHDGGLFESTLDLINRQKAKIEKLKKKNTILSKNADTAFQDGLDENRDLFKKEVEPEIRAEAIKEFGKFLIDKSKDGKICVSDIPDYVKEMTEVQE